MDNKIDIPSHNRAIRQAQTLLRRRTESFSKDEPQKGYYEESRESRAWKKAADALNDLLYPEVG